MGKDRVTDVRFFNSVIAGMADILFKWDGAVFTVMGQNVGRELLDIIAKDVNFNGDSTIRTLRELCRELVEKYQIADSIRIDEDREKECIEFVAENCVLLPFAKREIERNPFFRRIPVCPVKNMVMGVLENRGENTEIRSFDLHEDRCHVVIGLVEELPMEKELRKMGRSGSSK